MTVRQYVVLILTLENISIHGNVASFPVVTLKRFVPIAQMLLDVYDRRMQLVHGCIMGFAHYTLRHLVLGY